MRPYFAYLTIILEIILPIILLAQLQQVNGVSFFADLGRDVDDRTDTYQQGGEDGRAAGIADYPYKNSDCPTGQSTSYCLGWDGGYTIGFNEQKIMDESGRQNGNSDNNDDDNDD
jgi:hypothetical protein